MIELDNTMLLFIDSENYSGTKIPLIERSVSVQVPPEIQTVGMTAYIFLNPIRCEMCWIFHFLFVYLHFKI